MTGDGTKFSFETRPQKRQNLPFAERLLGCSVNRLAVVTLRFITKLNLYRADRHPNPRADLQDAKFGLGHTELLSRKEDQIRVGVKALNEVSGPLALVPYLMALTVVPL